MCKLEDKYREVVFSIEMGRDEDELKLLKIQGLFGVFRVFESYLNQGIEYWFAYRVLEKRLNYLLNANTSAEVKEALELSFTKVKGNGFIEGKYHIPEEELILLYSASKVAPLKPMVQLRLNTLIEKCYAECGGLKC